MASPILLQSSDDDGDDSQGCNGPRRAGSALPAQGGCCSPVSVPRRPPLRCTLTLVAVHLITSSADSRLSPRCSKIYLRFQAAGCFFCLELAGAGLRRRASSTGGGGGAHERSMHFTLVFRRLYVCLEMKFLLPLQASSSDFRFLGRNSERLVPFTRIRP